MDDLPFFGRITDIIVIASSGLLSVEKYNTVGINNHLLAYPIVRTHQFFVVNISLLCNPQPLCAHTFIGDNQLYVVLRSHILNTSKC